MDWICLAQFRDNYQSVLCITEIFWGFSKTGSIYWLAKEELPNNLCSLESLCDLCLNYCKFFWKWLSLEWEFTLAGREKSEMRGNRMETHTVCWSETYLKYLFNGFPRKFVFIPGTSIRWRIFMYCSAWSSTQNTEIVALLISAI